MAKTTKKRVFFVLKKVGLKALEGTPTENYSVENVGNTLFGIINVKLKDTKFGQKLSEQYMNKMKLVHVLKQIRTTSNTCTLEHARSDAVDRSSNTSETVIPPLLPV